MDNGADFIPKERTRFLARMKLSLGAAGAAGVGALLLSVSPVSCGCMPAAMLLGHELGMSTASGNVLPGDMTPASMQAAAARKFRGQPLASFVPPGNAREGDCLRVDARQLACVYWLEAGPLRKEGRLIKFFADQKGVIERVEVASVQQWFGRWARGL